MNYGSTVVENGLTEGMTNIVACVVKNKIMITENRWYILLP